MALGISGVQQGIARALAKAPVLCRQGHPEPGKGQQKTQGSLERRRSLLRPRQKPPVSLAGNRAPHSPNPPLQPSSVLGGAVSNTLQKPR